MSPEQPHALKTERTSVAVNVKDGDKNVDLIVSPVSSQKALATVDSNKAGLAYLQPGNLSPRVAPSYVLNALAVGC